MRNPLTQLVFYNSDEIFNVEHFADLTFLPRWTDLVRGELSGERMNKNLSQLDFSTLMLHLPNVLKGERVPPLDHFNLHQK